jgi:translation initiation factor IF-1
VAGVVLAELPQLVFRVDVGKGREVLAHAVGMTERNFVRLLPGDKWRLSWPRRTKPADGF